MLSVVPYQPGSLPPLEMAFNTWGVAWGGGNGRCTMERKTEKRVKTLSCLSKHAKWKKHLAFFALCLISCYGLILLPKYSLGSLTVSAALYLKLLLCFSTPGIAWRMSQSQSPSLPLLVAVSGDTHLMGWQWGPQCLCQGLENLISSCNSHLELMSCREAGGINSNRFPPRHLTAFIARMCAE